jgi:hypothetical protein
MRAFQLQQLLIKGENEIKIGNASNGKFLKKMNIELQYTTTTKIEIWVNIKLKKREKETLILLKFKSIIKIVNKN